MGERSMRHHTSADAVVDALRAAFGPGFFVRNAGPLQFGDSKPDRIVAGPGARRDRRAATRARGVALLLRRRMLTAHHPFREPHMKPKSSGRVEEQVSQAVLRFEKEYMGRGSIEARTYLVDDLVVVRLKNVLTPAELSLTSSGDRGRDLIKQMRQQLIETGAAALGATVAAVVGVEVRSMHTDLSTRTGERIIVFVLAQRPAAAGDKSAARS